MNEQLEESLKELSSLMEIRLKLKTLKSGTASAFSPLVRKGQEITPEIKEVLEELKRVSNEFSKSIHLTEELLKLRSKELMNFG